MIGLHHIISLFIYSLISFFNRKKSTFSPFMLCGLKFFYYFCKTILAII